jgi:hypothetical protein
MRHLVAIQRVLALAMLVWPVAFLSYAVRARLALGRWPRYNSPDPAVLGWPAHHVLVAVSFVISEVALLLLPIMVFVVWFAGRERSSRRWLLMHAVFSLANLAWFLFDPGRLIEWYGA